MALTVGTRLGPYEVTAPIGAGGMGEVYRARDLRLARDVAIKVLPARLADDGVALARFEREARAVAALSHPNILSIFDIGHDSGLTFAVTELLEGETLRQRLQGGALAPRKAVECAAQIAQGLAAAHEKGIVHRDLKPENVFVMPDGRVKILDFGLARQTDDTTFVADAPTAVALTGAGVVAGTPAYMAPEQVRGEAVTPQVDIFAFGSMLFEMLTGRRAFIGQAPGEIMSAVLRDDPPDVLTLNPAVPPPLAQLVRHCLEKQPGERFQSARDLAFNLQVLAGTPTPTPFAGHPSLIGEPGATPAGTPPPVAADLPFVRSRRRFAGGWLALGVLTAVAAGVLGGWLLLPRQRPAGPHFNRVSYTQKAIFRAAFAPEGATLIYSAAVNGNQPEIFTRTAEYPSARTMGLSAAHLLAVSPRGEMALLTKAHLAGPDTFEGTLSRMSIGAAAPRDLLDGVRDADWLPGGDELVVVRVRGDRDRIEWPGVAATYETSGYLSDLRVAPAGDRIAFIDHPYGWEGTGTLMLLDRAGKATALAGPFPYAHGVSWMPDGKEVVFSASPHGTDMAAIYAVAAGGKARLVLEGSGSLTIHDVSADGTWLVTRDDRRSGVRVLPPGATEERELSWLDHSSLAAFSDDGRAVLFSEFAAPAGANGTVCLRTTDGAPIVAVGSGQARDLSPDGRLALAVTYTPPQLLLYPTGAGPNRILPTGAAVEYRWAAFFPDGRRILACGAGKGVAARCFVQDVDGGAPRAVTETADAGLVSPDGSRIVAWSADAAPAIYPVSGGQPQAVNALTSRDVPIRWTVDGRALLVYEPHRVPGPIERIDLASGRRDVVRQIGAGERVGVMSIDALRVTPDGSSYAYGYTRLLSTLFTVTSR